jgi:hypothetical protein
MISSIMVHLSDLLGLAPTHRGNNQNLFQEVELVSVNQVNPESSLVELIRTASAKLFFLANKSQEQISEKYKMISKEIADISKTIEMEIG